MVMDIQNTAGRFRRGRPLKNVIAKAEMVLLTHPLAYTVQTWLRRHRGEAMPILDADGSIVFREPYRTKGFTVATGHSVAFYNLELEIRSFYVEKDFLFMDAVLDGDVPVRHMIAYHGPHIIGVLARKWVRDMVENGDAEVTGKLADYIYLIYDVVDEVYPEIYRADPNSFLSPMYGVSVYFPWEGMEGERYAEAYIVCHREGLAHSLLNVYDASSKKIFTLYFHGSDSDSSIPLSVFEGTAVARLVADSIEWLLGKIPSLSRELLVASLAFEVLAEVE